MTSRQKGIAALILVLFFVIAVPTVVLSLHLPEAIAIASAIISAVVFMVWSFIFSCPRCGTPFLWEIRGHTKIVRLIPLKRCRQCGLHTDEPYVSHRNDNFH